MTQRDASPWNSMITGNVHNNRLHDALAIFHLYPSKNVRKWTALVSAFAKAGRIIEARRLFDSMPARNVISWNAMISGYVQSGDLVSARELFDIMPERDIASWNSMITGYCHASIMTEARKMFDEMPVAAALTDLALIDSLRALILKFGLEMDIVVGTAVLNAYTRTGCLDSATDFFNMMPERNDHSRSTMIAAFSYSGRLNDAIKLYHEAPELNVASQSAMMTAYAQHGCALNGLGDEALIVFQRMQEEGVLPDEMTFLGVLCACSRADVPGDYTPNYI
ncbi:hypothetical protein V2J09_017409 [Rumex salicifolius]